MLTVACVLKSGGLYTADWVARLKAGVERHLPRPFRFVCLSDVDVPCERIALRHDWPGWWAKIEALQLPGPVLYLDLDTAIVGDLSEVAVAASTAPLAMLRDFYRGGAALGSGVMGWSDRDVTAVVLHDRFLRDPQGWMRQAGGRGDQGFIEDAVFSPGVVRWQDAVPGQVVSYKVHCRAGVPRDARIVCLHGRPKFTDMAANDPVRLAWEAA